MKILITGATGAIGREIGKKLVSLGHELTILSRNTEEAKTLIPFPAKILPWEHYSNSVPSTYFNGIDSVIHLAGESIFHKRWTEKQKKLILESRTRGTQNIVNAIKKSNQTVKQFISASSIGVYGHGDNLVSEKSPTGNDFWAKACSEWENEAQRLNGIGINVINARIGIVLSRESGVLAKILSMFNLGLGNLFASTNQWISWIHQEDLTNIFVQLVHHPEMRGVFNLVAPAPTSNKVFKTELAKILEHKMFFPIPRWGLKFIVGESFNLFLGGPKVSSDKISTLRFDFKFKDIQSALQGLCFPLKNGQKEIFSEIWLPKKASEVFSFFCDEKNLEKLTPQYLNFYVLKKSTDVIEEGTLIDYKLSLHGVPLRWKSRIENWELNKRFDDRQIQGPYKLWHHRHDFEAFAGGTIVRDRVLYKLPFGRVGELISGPLVRIDLHKIFSYRRKVIAKIYS